MVTRERTSNEIEVRAAAGLLSFEDAAPFIGRRRRRFSRGPPAPTPRKRNNQKKNQIEPRERGARPTAAAPPPPTTKQRPRTIGSPSNGSDTWPLSVPPSLLPSFTGFYWVLPSSTKFYWVLTEFYRVLPSFTGFYWVLLRVYLVLLRFTKFYWVSLGFTGLLVVVTVFDLVFCLSSSWFAGLTSSSWAEFHRVLLAQKRPKWW